MRMLAIVDKIVAAGGSLSAITSDEALALIVFLEAIEPEIGYVSLADKSASVVARIQQYVAPAA
jgi:hypothetical protein